MSELSEAKAVSEIGKRSCIVVRYAVLSSPCLFKEERCTDWFAFADWLKDMNEQGHCVIISHWTYLRITEDQQHSK